MNESEKKEKIKDEVQKKIKEKIETDEMVDVSDNATINDPHITMDVNKADADAGSKKDFKTDSMNIAEDVPQETGKLKDSVNEVRNLFNDNKAVKNSPKKESLNENNATKQFKDAKDKLKNEVKPVVDEAKNAVNQLKEQGKNVAAKAGGAAISYVTGGVVPPKLGEWASKKALDKIEKDNKKRASKIKKEIKNKIDDKKEEIKNKINENENLQKIKQKGNDVLNKVGKTVKAIKTYKLIKKFAPIIAVAIVIFVAIAGVASVVAVIQTYVPGIFGDVKEEVDTTQYSKRDQKILKNIENVVNKYPNVSTTEASNILATVSYPYHELLQNDNVKNSSNVEDDDSEEDDSDKMELLFESDSNLTASEKYEKYKLIYTSGLDAGKEFLKSEFEEWLADKFGYEVSEDDDSDDGNQNNDMYLTMYKKDEYIDKFDELMNVYSTQGKAAYEEYLKSTYYNEDDGYKKLLNTTDTEDKEELIEEIQKDVSDNTDLYEVYIPISCVTSGSSTTQLNLASNAGDVKGAIYVTLRDYFADNDGTFRTSGYYNSPVLYNTDTEPLTFARYIMGVVYAESESCLNTESCAKALMITAKSFAIGRQSSMGYKPEYIESEDKTIIHMRGNVGDQDFCDVYEGCESGRFSKDSWSVFTGEGYNNRKGPLSQDKLTQLEQWWNEIANLYVINKETKDFVGNQYSDYNSSCHRGSCVSQKELKSASEKESDYMNLLFDLNNGGFDNSKYTLYDSNTNGVYAVTTGTELCPTGDINASRQAIVDFARSMVGKIPYYFYEGQSDGYGALGHAISKNFDDNHFGETASLTDHSGRNKYGLDCSGFVDFVFWNVLGDNLGNGNTDTLKSVSTKIDYSDLKPGDLGFLNDGSSGTEQHVGIYIGDDKWVELNPSGVTEGTYPDFKVYYRPNILVELDAKETSGESTGELQSPISDKSPTCNDYPNYSSGSYHGGTDIVVSEGTEVMAMDGGTVIESKDITSGDCSGSRRCNGGYYSYGRVIYIEHDNGLVTKYAHLSERLVQKGDSVSKGQVIGRSGNTGNSTGAHLHIEVSLNGKNQSPCDYIK